MIWLFGLALVLIFSFGAVLLFGAPYLPTLRPQVEQAMELVNLKSGQTLIELGCGDGRVLIAAARQGINAIGYELNPFLALIAWVRTRSYKNQIKIICGNFWTRDLPKGDAIFTFLLPKYMAKLDAKLAAYEHKPIKLVSIAFAIPGKTDSSPKKMASICTCTNNKTLALPQKLLCLKWH